MDASGTTSTTTAAKSGCTSPTGRGQAHWAPRDMQPLPCEDLALPIERKVIAVFGNQHLSEQGRGRQALGDRPFRGRSLMDRAAGAASITGSADADNPQPRGDMVEHLARGLADQMQFTAAAGAHLMLKIEPLPSRADVLAGLVDRSAISAS